MTGTNWDGLILLLVLGLPALGLFLYLRKPIGGPVPRDAMASRAKAELSNPILPLHHGQAYEDTILDECHDSGPAGPADRDGNGLDDTYE